MFSGIQIYSGYKLRTYLMGFPYNSTEMDDADEEFDDSKTVQFHRKLMKISLMELQQRTILNKFLRKTKVEEVTPQETAPSPTIKQLVQEGEEEMEITLIS